MRAALRSLLVLACLAPAATLGAGDVWRWTDAQGIVHYSDVPVPGAERVRRSITRSTSAAAGNAAQPSATPTPVTNALAQQRQANATTQTVQQDVAKKRAEQCAQAKTKYDTLITSHRVYREDKPGQRTYLSAEELDKARATALQERDTLCGPAAR